MARRRKGINDLPDCLLCLILSKVPIKQAVCCSVLSQRWKLLWRSLPNLSITEDIFDSSYGPVKIQNIIDDFLMLHSVPIGFFQLHNINSFIPSAKINDWIHLAALKDVREMSIQAIRFSIHGVVEVPTSIFSCCKLRCLALTNFRLENVPGSCGGFACLTTLYFHQIKLNEKTFELMLQFCPVLEILIVHNCYGIWRIKICSPSLLFLNLDCPSSIKAVTVNCPRLVSLTIKTLYDVETMEFELPTCLHLWTSASRVSRLEPFATLKSLTKMTLLNGIYESDVSFLHKFPDLKQICIDNAKYPVQVS